MPPKPHADQDDALDLDGLDLKQPGAKAKAAESDFEKELEALFAEELASSDEKPASAPPASGAELEEEALLLDDLVETPPPAPAPGVREDILDLGGFSAVGDIELSPPEVASGGESRDLDLSGLDELISGLGDSKASAAPAKDDGPSLDDMDMSALLDSLDTPVAKPAAAEPEDGLLELSLGDLVDGEPLAGESGPAPAPQAAASLLDLTLPDLSDPTPGRDLIAEQELADKAATSDVPPGSAAGASASVEQLLDSGDLDMTGLMQGLESSSGEPAAEKSLDPQDLLAQIAETPAAEPAPAAAAEGGLSLADAALGVATAGAVAAAGVAVAAAVGKPAAPAAAPQAALGGDVLAELQERLAQLADQVSGTNTALAQLEGKLSSRDQALAETEERLLASQNEAQALRDELSALRARLENDLRNELDALKQQAEQTGKAAQAAADSAQALVQRVDGAEKAASSAGERLGQVEVRQAQLDSEIMSEITRAVPREAARVIREEIAILAASMHDE